MPLDMLMLLATLGWHEPANYNEDIVFNGGGNQENITLVDLSDALSALSPKAQIFLDILARKNLDIKTSSTTSKLTQH